jgi:chromosome segregation ATPase
LQNKHDALTENTQQLTSDVQHLQQQLADAHSAFAGLQQQNLQLTDVKAKLQLHVEAATREYRANDIICCHLRDQITKLHQQLANSQQTCKQQV